MLYHYHPGKKLTDAEFRDPGKEYRGAPFWAWNTKLRREELLRQIEELKEMGFGGFHMHARNGLGTEYLSREFLDLIDACAEKAEQEDMLAYLYDEDRWPSGFAGGFVTADHPEYRRRMLVVSPTPAERSALRVGRFDVELNADGTLASYRLLSEGETAAHNEWFADVVIDEETPRFNNATYVDTLNPEAIRLFLQKTHEVFKKRLGKRFGKSIPSIFTDEPQFGASQMIDYSNARTPIQLTWTDDLPRTYAEAFGGEDLVAHIPELIWNLPGDRPSAVRWRYHDHVCERFASAFMDQSAKWCEENGLLQTGHMMCEDTLLSQTRYIGDAMRSYRGMALPGIDMLCGAHHYETAKQCQSAVHQYGREGMMSELYGVLGWDLDFRGHKHHGDWQAALGVTLRVPHLSLVSMAGEAKRDYPQTIHYQSPWYRKYPLVEDHFARVNTAMTRGKAVERVAVIHPIESLWLHYGANDRNSLQIQQLESNHRHVAEWLLFGGIDFDYICEALLPSQTEKGGNPLRVGAASYDAVVVPECETLRSTTLERLEAFRQAGGKLIFLGAAPTAVDAVPDSRAEALFERSLHLPFSRVALLNALEDCREVEFRYADGKGKGGSLTDNLLYQLREEENGDRWLFVAHGKLTSKPYLPTPQNIRVRLRGGYRAELYDTVTGTVSPVASTVRNGWTELRATLWEYDSLLLRLTPSQDDVVLPAAKEPRVLPVATPALVNYELSEPNVFLLDMAEYALDGGPWQPTEEILRIDTACRNALGWPIKGGKGEAQPWVFPEEPSTHRVAFRFTVPSEIATDRVLLAIERPEITTVVWNGKKVTSAPVGYYVDRDIKTLELDGLLVGRNVLELEMPFEKRVPPEWCYLLGDFGVRVQGSVKTVTKREQVLGFGNIVGQGLPFWSGALTYVIPVEVPREGELKVHIPQYNAAVLEAAIDGGAPTAFAFSPYTASLGKVAPGKHTLRLTAYVNRSNTFAALHNTDPAEYYDPPIWRTTGDRWSYEYHFFTEGILSSPQVTLEV